MYKKGLFLAGEATAGGGLAFGLTQIYTIFGIILTVVSLIVLLVNFILRLKDRLSDGKFTNEEKAETAKEIIELKETIDRLQKEIDSYGNKNK